MMPRKVDNNQKEIVSMLRQMGASVLILSDVGKGCPDICVGFKGKCYLIEIKNGKLPPARQQLTPMEKMFFLSWQGHAEIIKSVNEAVDFMEKIKSGVEDTLLAPQ